MKYIKSIGALLVIVLLLAACSGSKIETNMSRDIQPFTFTTQDNKTLSNKDLEGKWWIADMIFTNCTSVCLPMTANMTKLQKQAKRANLDVQFVSFSVDPKRDTPEVLKKYAEQYGIDFSNWSFLTGYDFDTIKKISIKSFQAPVVKPAEDSDQYTHGTSFYLVNPDGEVVKRYSGLKKDDMNQVMEDLYTVLK
ncbi:SCO family protein [Virgibacillus sp. 179-BFC.A HS]|uniref:SCO family protein n=1 Tax=Tigheibacillus jepli TaxID=3035914 RepID=A0ABU5CFE0_9BACI|nr:SCO family protein [Virgibacillus sp. 179-BFC.A HS]MDY0404930.1 SCO family protein [Virgibacillus sp. 179-BFC.A HS]